MHVLTHSSGQQELQGVGEFPGPVPAPGPPGTHSDPDVHLVTIAKWGGGEGVGVRECGVWISSSC